MGTSTPRHGIRDLHGKVAVVTGAAGGIGRAVTLGLWAKGCHLALVDLDSDGLVALRASLQSVDRTQRATSHVANVADRARMHALADEVAAAHGAVHVLVNNAGVSHESMFSETDLGDWEHVVGVNLWGVIYGCRFFLPHLARGARAHIVNVSSLLGIVAMPGQSAYCASKFAVRGFTETLCEELRETSIGVTVVCPGAVATNIMRRATGQDRELLERISRWYERHAMPPERVAARIVRAIETGAPRLVIGPDARLADVLRRLMPITGNRLFTDLAIRLLGVQDVRAARLAQWRATTSVPRPEPPPVESDDDA